MTTQTDLFHNKNLTKQIVVDSNDGSAYATMTPSVCQTQWGEWGRIKDGSITYCWVCQVAVLGQRCRLWLQMCFSVWQYDQNGLDNMDFCFVYYKSYNHKMNLYGTAYNTGLRCWTE